MSITSTRYQNGSLTIERRKSGLAVWVYRWREEDAKGDYTRRKRLVGTKEDFPTKALAKREVDGLRIEINNEANSLSKMTIHELIEHFILTELCESNPKTMRTKQVYEHQLRNVISPHWGSYRLRDVKPVQVEAWLKKMPLAPGSKAKTKGVMGIIFQHAMRYEWATSNPIRLVRQGSLSLQEQIVLEPVEIAALIQELRDPFSTLILLVSVTGLRRGELFGLKWEDIDFLQSEIRVVRSVVDQVEGPPKTLASRRPVPMSQALAESLQAWKKRTSFSTPQDWVFASPANLGRRPYWPDAVLKRHILPAAKRAGITKKIAWHSFRRTLATLLQHSGASVKTTQELMRHSSPVMTLGTYAKAVTADKRHAQDSIVELILPVNGCESVA
jgi:integrase